MEDKQNLERLFTTVKNYFSPKIVDEVNDVYIKIVKIKGHEVPWHSHDNEDELFFVVKGSMTIELKTGKVIQLNEGEFFTVKKGIEHTAYSEDECSLILIENKTAKHTGDVQSRITKTINQQKY